MACILHIETSTDVCSVAVSENGMCIYDDEMRRPNAHASQLAPFVRDAISFADNHAICLDAVSVSMGPGSFTGLRIGVSEAKGVCFGRDLKLIAVSTLKLLCVKPLLEMELPEDALLCPMIDARRMEVYTATFDRALREIQPIRAEIVNEKTFDSILESRPVFFLGDGASKCRDIIRSSNAYFIDGIFPQAKYMLPLAEMAMARKQFEDIAYFEPFYLKEFVAGKSKKI